MCYHYTIELVPPEGLEPSTFRLEVYCAIQLRQGGVVRDVGFEPTHVETYRVLNPTP